jgi:hypothetical protein
MPASRLRLDTEQTFPAITGLGNLERYTLDFTALAPKSVCAAISQMIVLLAVEYRRLDAQHQYTL